MKDYGKRERMLFLDPPPAARPFVYIGLWVVSSIALGLFLRAMWELVRFGWHFLGLL